METQKWSKNHIRFICFYITIAHLKGAALHGYSSIILNWIRNYYRDEFGHDCPKFNRETPVQSFKKKHKIVLLCLKRYQNDVNDAVMDSLLLTLNRFHTFF